MLVHDHRIRIEGTEKIWLAEVSRKFLVISASRVAQTVHAGQGAGAKRFEEPPANDSKR